MMVDKPKCEQMLSNLDRYLTVLEEHGRVPGDAFLGNKDKIGSAKYHFVIAIEACIDVANHIIASERYRMPRDNADSFTVLVENGVLPEDKRTSFPAMARFRNRLVHLYWDVDDGLVHEYLQTRLGDLRCFLTEIAAFVQRQADDTRLPE
jgi:uncharacterized protein YutE (UPF0331/DUF86 family)